jgi:hypothetical protein
MRYKLSSKGRFWKLIDTEGETTRERVGPHIYVEYPQFDARIVRITYKNYTEFRVIMQGQEISDHFETLGDAEKYMRSQA